MGRRCQGWHVGGKDGTYAGVASLGVSRRRRHLNLGGKLFDLQRGYGTDTHKHRIRGHAYFTRTCPQQDQNTLTFAEIICHSPTAFSAFVREMMRGLQSRPSALYLSVFLSLLDKACVQLRCTPCCCTDSVVARLVWKSESCGGADGCTTMGLRPGRGFVATVQRIVRQP